MTAPQSTDASCDLAVFETVPASIPASANEEYFRLYGAKLDAAIRFLRGESASHRNYSIYVLDYTVYSGRSR